jgi:hypothetical protein
MRLSRWAGLTIIALSSSMWASSAWAADLLSGYQAVSAQLGAARASVGSNVAVSSQRLDGARNVFRKLSVSIRSQKLVPDANTAFDRARTAITRGSATDLEAQTSQVTRILERALYEELLYDMSTGRFESAASYAGALGRALGVPSSRLGTLKTSVAKGDTNRVRALLENGVANIMLQNLQAAKQRSANLQSPRNQVAVFSNTVRASNAFIVVQDSPKAGNLAMTQFSEALGKLVRNDFKGFGTGLNGLIQKTTRFAYLSKVAIAQAKPTTARPKPRVGRPVQPGISGVALSGVNAVANVKAMTSQFTQIGVPGLTAQRLAGHLGQQGYSHFGQAIDAVTLKLARGLSDVQNADIARGRAAIGQANALFERDLEPVIKAGNRDLAERIGRLFQATQAAYSLRPVDVMTLIGETDAIRRWSNNQPALALQGASASVQDWWMGGGLLGNLGLRSIIFLIVALAFAYPIYLLRLAFGGRNPYWNYIGIAMVLLFVPPLIEGIAGLGSLIAQGLGIGGPLGDFLNGLSNLSVLQNPIAQIAWAVMLIATVVLATIGFRGIAAQFGLIRTRANAAPAMATTATGAMMSTSTKYPTLPKHPTLPKNPTMGTGGRTVVEWDEEF